MKKRIIFILVILLFSVGCHKATLDDSSALNDNFVSIKIDPPVVYPGSDITVDVVLDNGMGILKDVDIQIGNYLFAQQTQAQLSIPADISKLFGEKVLKQFWQDGYVDVPVKIATDGKKAEKYFRIAVHPIVYIRNYLTMLLSFEFLYRIELNGISSGYTFDIFCISSITFLAWYKHFYKQWRG